jgi:competence protein ComEC
VISAGSYNPYGHPSPDTVARLEETGSRVFRTDLDGSVELSIDGGTIRAASSGPRGTTGPAVAIAAAALPPAFACAVPAADPSWFAANPPLPSGP